MVDPAAFPVFFVAAWALIIAPGPDMLYVITRGMAQGRRAGLVSALGVTLGIVVHTVAAAFGLAVLLQTSAIAFLAVKYAGAAYLIYLGLKSLRSKEGFAVGGVERQGDLTTILWQGVLSNVFNPKVALFFLAFLPQFVDPTLGHATLQMLSLGLLFAFFGVLFLSLVGYFSGGIGKWLSQKQRLAGWLGRLAGGVFIGLGVRLALVERRP